MTTNAMWWVSYRYTAPNGAEYNNVLSLMSPDLTDPRKAKARAKATAIPRIRKKLSKVKFRILDVRCVG